jgi:uncharacterized membrane-anchored protein
VITVLNAARILMMLWIAYALVLLFEPALLHHSPDPIGASIQALAAFGLGYLMDRMLALLLRRKAERVQAMPAGAGDGTNPDGRI